MMKQESQPEKTTSDVKELQNKAHTLFSGIPFARKIAYLLIIGALPCLFLFFYFAADHESASSLLNHMRKVNLELQVKKQKELQSTLIRKNFKNKDHFYLEKLKKEKFLTSEIERFQKSLSGSFHPDEESIRKRIAFLSGHENSLSFNESAEKTFAGIKETQAQLIRPVEVNTSDIKKILTLIEVVSCCDVQIPELRPQLIITDFKIERKKTHLSDTYQLQIKLLKREVIQ